MKYADMKKLVLDELRHHFRPEFLNRVDEIVVFNALTMEDLKQIVEIQIGRLKARLKERRIEIELTEGAKMYLARKGHNPSFGARPLKRLIQHEIQNPIEHMIIQGRVKDGSKVIVDAVGDSLDFRVEPGGDASSQL